MDFGWKGKYDTSYPTEQTIEDYLSVSLFSIGKFHVHFELFKFMFAADFVFVPLEVIPIKAKILYTNPLAVARYQEDITGLFKLSHEIKAGDFYIEWLKDLKVPKYSFYDYLFKDGPAPYPKDIDSEFKYNPELRMFKDPNSKNNLFKIYAKDAPITKAIKETVFFKYDLVKAGL